VIWSNVARVIFSSTRFGPEASAVMNGKLTVVSTVLDNVS
jgi:hypothetical protein